MSTVPPVRARRSFLSRLAAGAAAFSGVALQTQTAGAQSASAPFRAARHTQDDWLDQIPGSHRFVIDTTMPLGFGSALLFANNFFVANQSGYGLGNADAAVVIVARHNSTCFAFNDAMWRKYGAALGEAAANFDDPKTKMRPSANVYNATNYGSALPNNGVTLEALIKRGVHFAVCDMATNRFARAVAASVKGNADEVYKELTANVIPNSHLVAAGIVAVNRAQERGYSFANAG